MSDAPELGIWSKFDPEVWREIQEKTAAIAQKKQTKQNPERKRKRWRLLVLSTFSIVLWVYFPIKVFVADIDRWLAMRVAPEYVWLLQFRSILTLIALTTFALAFKRRQWWMLLYVAGWPMIVVFWFVPRFLYRRRSWTMTIGLVHASLGLFRGIRVTLVAFTLSVIAGLLALSVKSAWILGLAASVLLVVWIVSLLRAFRYAIAPDRFVRAQRGWSDKILGSAPFWNAVNVEATVRSTDVDRFNEQQVQSIVTRASLGLTACRASQFWASRLDEYRRSPASVLFGALAVLGLFVQSVLTFTLVNLAIYKMDPNQFASSSPPSLAIFVYYAFSASLGSEISALAPVGGTAAIAQVAAGFSTAVVVLVLVLALIFGVKQSRFDQSAIDSIRQMRANANAFEERLGEEYDTTAEDLLERVMDLSSSFAGILAFLSREIPDPGEPKSS